MYRDGQTVNVPVVINERKVYLLNVLHVYTQQIVTVLPAVILHEHSIAQVSCWTGTILKRFTCHS